MMTFVSLRNDPFQRHLLRFDLILVVFVKVRPFFWCSIVNSVQGLVDHSSEEKGSRNGKRCYASFRCFRFCVGTIVVVVVAAAATAVGDSPIGIGATAINLNVGVSLNAQTFDCLIGQERGFDPGHCRARARRYHPSIVLLLLLPPLVGNFSKFVLRTKTGLIKMGMKHNHNTFICSDAAVVITLVVIIVFVLANNKT